MLFIKNKIRFTIIILACLLCGVIIYYTSTILFTDFIYSNKNITILNTNSENIKPLNIVTAPTLLATPIVVNHIKTPPSVKAVYISSWTAGSPKYRDPIIKLIDDTELNAIVIDIKDSTGRIGFMVSNHELQKMGTTEKRIPDIRALTNLLHQKNIYIIGRIAVFQDPYGTKIKPEWSIIKKSDGKIWEDHKGLSFLDPANKEVWKYIVAIARDAYDEGFDEINFDYIRYPSDGNIKDINYHLLKGKTRSDNIEEFVKYLSREIKLYQNIPMSADLFGLTTQATDDMGMGQIWEKMLPYFDFLSPMVYPSHYPPMQDGFKNPALHPYEIINKALKEGVNKTKAQNQDINKIRPWLQDFNLGAVYTKEMVQSEIKAVNDNSLTSWMLWDPRNKYTSSALKLEK